MSTHRLSDLANVRVGVPGATGTVGQRFIRLIDQHPFFVLEALGASSRSSGQKYSEAVKGRWKQTCPIPHSARDIVVQPCEPGHFSQCAVVFSGLDADVAGDIELAFRAAELAVFSNSKNHRRDPVVPLVVPLVNPSHMSMLPMQRQSLSLSKGFLVTNANCSTTGLVVPLAALEKKYGPLESVMYTTLQAISGAGYPGVSSMDISDNVVPYIGGEEEKIEWETAKILGGLTSEGTFDMHEDSPLRVSASCNRVNVIEGHTGTVSIRFSKRPPPSPQQVRETFEAFTCEAQALHVPSAPMHAIYVHEEKDRPQPRLDRDFDNGAGVHVGRVRQCPVLDIKFVVMSNNVAIGAATSSIMNAEIAIARGIIDVQFPQ